MNRDFNVTVAGAVFLVMANAVPVAADDTKIISADDVEWSPAPEIMPEGIEITVLAGNPEDGFFVMRVRIPNGTEIPPHWESEAEHITVLQGTFHIGTGKTFDKTATTPITAGGFISMPADQPHFAWAEGTTVLESVGMGPTKLHYVDPEDNPSRQEAIE